MVQAKNLIYIYIFFFLYREENLDKLCATTASPSFIHCIRRRRQDHTRFFFFYVVFLLLVAARETHQREKLSPSLSPSLTLSSNSTCCPASNIALSCRIVSVLPATRNRPGTYNPCASKNLLGAVASQGRIGGRRGSQRRRGGGGAGGGGGGEERSRGGRGCVCSPNRHAWP